MTIPKKAHNPSLPNVWLFGDSIIDNSYWNNVDANNTANVLTQILPEYNIMDRSTEELQASTMIKALRSDGQVQVRSCYVNHRNNIGCPYEATGKSFWGNSIIDVSAEGQMGPDDKVVISLGGNDFALGHNSNVD